MKRLFSWIIGLGFVQSYALAQTKTATSMTMVEPLEIQFGLGFTDDWLPLNDNVMGGQSLGRVNWAEDAMHWSGSTSLANNGGFASVRSPWDKFDLQEYDQVILTCRGSGGPFKLTMETSTRWWMPYAYASFTPSDEWHDITLPLSDFVWSQAQWGDFSTSPSKQSLGQILRLGVMKYDGTAQDFQLDISSIQFRKFSDGL